MINEYWEYEVLLDWFNSTVHYECHVRFSREPFQDNFHGHQINLHKIQGKFSTMANIYFPNYARTAALPWKTLG